jgi:hypothetical protein
VVAIRNYFAVAPVMQRGQLRLLLVRGSISLLIGLTFLAVCCRCVSCSGDVEPGDAILSEGLLILGWVAMWKPVEIFLYDWWPDLDSEDCSSASRTSDRNAATHDSPAASRCVE